jgi:hypothetical protein
MNSTVTVLYKVSKEIVTFLKTILVNKLVCTANYKVRCLLNVAIPVKFVACVFPLYPQSLTLISNTQKITQKSLNSDVLHTDRHSGSVRIAVIAAVTLSPRLNFGIFVFKIWH